MKKSYIYLIIATFLIVAVTGCGKTTRYYQYYSEGPDGNYKSREIEFKSDGSVKYASGGPGVAGVAYKGTYTEDDSKIVMDLEQVTEDGKCNDDIYLNACKITLTFNKLEGNKLVEKYPDSGTEITYSKVNKSSFKIMEEFGM